VKGRADGGGRVAPGGASTPPRETSPSARCAHRASRGAP
jgi:hypothetical protein